FTTAVAPETFIARRDRPGGPAEPALTDALATYAGQLTTLQTATQTRATRHAAAANALTTAFTALQET
ncbi:MAG: argininosuccinate lyase, partial [Pseudomonadota bacterium]